MRHFGTTVSSLLVFCVRQSVSAIISVASLFKICSMHSASLCTKNIEEETLTPVHFSTINLLSKVNAFVEQCA